MSIDYSIALFLYNFGEKYPSLVYFFAEYFPYIVGVLAFLVILQWVNSTSRLFITLATSLVVSRFMLLPLIRFFIERPRPFVSHEIFNPSFEPAGSSFPSGHATVFFTLAAVMYSWNKKMGVFFFVSATLISIARVFAGVHYPLDIIAGAILGVLVGFVIVRYIPVYGTKK